MDQNDSSEEYSSEEETGKHKWFPVELPVDFDPNKVPTSGEEYLHFVMYEAKKCQAVAVGNIDIRKYAANQTFSVKAVERCADAPKSMIPTLQWQEEKIAGFTRFRKYVATRLPRLANIDTCDHLHWLQKMDKEFPKFSVVSKFNPHAQICLLELIIHKLCRIKAGETISDPVGCWIYSILSILQIPLNPNMHSTLRNLSRQCALIRSKLSDDSVPDTYTHLNLLICIVGRYFGQHDLADN